jgi:hypothetical protein
VAISYVGGKGAGTAGQGGGSITLTTGLTGGSGGAPIAGDLVVVTVSVGTQARAPTLAISTPSGYTALTAQRTTATTYDTNVQTCYKVMGGTPDTAVTIPASGNNADGIAYTIQVFRGVDGTTPMDATPTYATGSGTDNRPNPAAITPVTAGAWIVCCGGGAAAAGTTLYTAAYLTNLLTYNGADTNDGTVGSGYYTGWTSGAYDPAVFGGGSVNAANSWGATTLALRPAVNNYTLTAQGGSYTLTGQSATLIRSKLVTASGGSYAIAGQQATITYTPAAINYQLTAQGGSYALTGQSATISRDRRLTSSGGSYALTGGTATILRTKVITAQGGAYALTGQQSVISKSKLITAQGGTYSVTGQQAIIERDRTLTAQGGAYISTGQQATITYTGAAAAYTLTAQGGVYELSGGSASIQITGNQPADTPDGYFGRMWAKMAEREKQKRETIEDLEEDLAEIEQDIEEVKAEIKQEYRQVNILPNPQFEARAKILELLIAESARIISDIEEEEILLLL